jgi:endoglucanase
MPRIQDYANDQLNYALGSNPMNVPYIVGSNPNSPQNPHSAMASGGNDLENINTSPPQMAYTLYGAVIGGPDKKDRYFDLRNDWPQTEVALDYNAPMLSLVAQQAMNNAEDPFFTKLQEGAYDSVRPQGTPCDPVYPCKTGSHLSTGGKIAIAVVVTVVGLAILGGIGYMLWIRRNNKY